MASLKEVKTRINSVNGTKKITEARQMVSSAHLHRALSSLAAAAAFDKALWSIASRFSASEYADSPLAQEHKSGAVAVVMASSNSGMVGAFNAKMIKEASEILAAHPGEEVVFYPVGKKIRDALSRGNAVVEGEYDNLVARSSYSDCRVLADELMREFVAGRFRRVELVTYHFISAVSQQITHRTLLPFSLPEDSDRPSGEVAAPSELSDNIILEPSAEAIREKLVPAAIRSALYAAIVDNQTSEHAARTIAMQLASENANDLLEELNLMYNKLRQQNITKELLDIVGSSFA
jgi:F-type H+-transporting ATPase subunit gamma